MIANALKQAIQYLDQQIKNYKKGEILRDAQEYGIEQNLEALRGGAASNADIKNS